MQVPVRQPIFSDSASSESDESEVEQIPRQTQRGRRKSTGGILSHSAPKERQWERANGINGSRPRLVRSPIPSVTFNVETRKVHETPTSVQPLNTSPRVIESTSSSPNCQSQDSSLRDLFTQVLTANTSTQINYPPPSKFNKATNVNEWIREMDLYLELCNIRDRKKTVYWAYLDDPTRKMLQYYMFNENDDIAVEQLKEKLKELYGRIPKGALDHMKDFSSRKQQPNENVRMYEVELEYLCKQAFPNCLNYESYIIDQFTEGVLNRKLQHELMTKRPDNIVDMIELATQYENAYIKQTKQRDGSTKTPTTPTTTTTSTQQPYQQTQAQTATTTNTNNTPRITSSSQVGNYNNRQQQPSYNAPKPCYQCNSTEHLMRDCPSRARPSNSTAVSVATTSINTNHV
jgi:hypothetical protein